MPRVFASFLILFGLSCPTRGNAETPRGHATLPDGFIVEIDIADTLSQRTAGLMFRPVLPENRGMLFVYPEPQSIGVWMKNTLISLDVVFLTAEGVVVDVLPNQQPCVSHPCPIYSSSTPAQYMLELKAGSAEKHKLGVGQEILLDYQHAVPTN